MNIESVELHVDNQKISAKLFKPTEPTKKLAILFLHGWTGKPNENAAKYMAQNGYYSLTISMRGHSPSDGDIKTITAQNSLDDALVSYDFLKQKLPKGMGIIAVGNSYGSYIAILLSEKRKIAALSLRVPAVYPDSNYDQPHWGRGSEDNDVNKWRQKTVHFSENKVFQLLHDFPGNVQIIEGEDDEIIPKRTIQNYINAVSDPRKLDYQLMKGWPHSIGNNEKIAREFEQVLIAWVDKLD